MVHHNNYTIYPQSSSWKNLELQGKIVLNDNTLEGNLLTVIFEYYQLNAGKRLR